MISFSIDPVYVNVGLPALAIGLVLGLLLMGIVARSKRKALLDDLEQAEVRLKNQEALEEERKAAFELANARSIAWIVFSIGTTPGSSKPSRTFRIVRCVQTATHSCNSPARISKPTRKKPSGNSVSGKKRSKTS